MSRQITEKMVKGLKPAISNYIVYDSEVRGFGVRVTPAGAIAFVLNYYVGSRERRYTIGRYPAASALWARDQAITLRQEIMKGHDPLGERERVRGLPTVRELASEYLSRHAEPNKRPLSVREDKRLLNAIILPRLGTLQVSTIRRNDIENLNRDLAGTPAQANRVLALLHKMFELAADPDWAYVAEDFRNPAHGIQRYPETARERWLRGNELGALLAELDKHPDQEQADAVRLILLTGSRKTETLCAKWSEMDLDRGVWTKPSHHTKQKRPEHVPLNESALELLRRRQKVSTNEYIFPGKDGGHRKDVKNLWLKVTRIAGVQDVRVHDLRHTFASHLVSSGEPLTYVGKLLGHTQPQTTHRYAHLADEPLRSATSVFSALYQKSNGKAGK